MVSSFFSPVARVLDPTAANGFVRGCKNITSKSSRVGHCNAIRDMVRATKVRTSFLEFNCGLVFWYWTNIDLCSPSGIVLSKSSSVTLGLGNGKLAKKMRTRRVRLSYCSIDSSTLVVTVGNWMVRRYNLEKSFNSCSVGWGTFTFVLLPLRYRR